MTAFDHLSMTGRCSTCQQAFYIELHGPNQKTALSNARSWVKDGHFCPGPPELNGLEIPTEEQVANA